MSQCPHCRGELTPDPSNPGKLLCYNCKKRYDAAAVDGYWAAQGGQPAQPAQPTQAGAQPYMPQNGVYQPNPAAPYDPNTVPAYMQPNGGPGKGMAVASLVIGILAILSSIIPLLNVVAIVMGIVAVILGIVAVVKAKKGTAAGAGFGIGGLVCGALAIIVSVAINVLVIDLATQATEDIDWSNVNELVEETENGNSIEFNYSYNSNSANSNSGANANSTSVNIVPQNATGAWMDGKMTIDGYEVTLGKTTVKELVEHTKFKVDDDKYTSGYVINAGDIVSVVSIAYGNANAVSAYINVANNGGAAIDFMDSTLTGIDVYDNADSSNPTLSLELSGDVKLGSSKTDVMTVYGEPESKSESSEYSLFEYTDGESTKYLDIYFDENDEVDEIDLSIYE